MSSRTSVTDPIEVAWITDPTPGQVGLTFAPGKRGASSGGAPGWDRDLDLDLDRLVGTFGMTMQVVLVEDPELRLLGIPGLVDAARSRGVQVLRLPIPDGGTPPDAAALRALLAEIQAHVRAGGKAVIHCRGGLGRAGVVGGCLLVARGVDPEQALLRLAAARGPSCPENAAQRAFVRGWPATRVKG